MLLVGWQEGHPACKYWVVRYWRVCLERGANDLHMVQLMPLPYYPIITCSSKIQNGLPLWCRLTQVVLEKTPLNGCSSSSSSSCCCCSRWTWVSHFSLAFFVSSAGEALLASGVGSIAVPASLQPSIFDKALKESERTDFSEWSHTALASPIHLKVKAFYFYSVVKSMVFA